MDPNQNNQQVMPETPQAPAPSVVTPPPPVPKRKFHIKKLLIGGIIVVLLGGGVIVASQILKNQTGDVTSSAEEHTFEEFPNFPAIPITENTVSFAKVDNKFCLRYRGHIYLEQNSGSYEVREVESDNPDQYPWYGLVDAPEGLLNIDGSGDEVFSFKGTPSNKSFSFVMHWNTGEEDAYYMYRFNNNELSQLRVFTREDGLFFVPKLNEFSFGGNFVNIHLFPCPSCTDQVPETLLYYIPTGEVKEIGRVSQFSWGEDDNTYEYKEYQEGVDPDSLPLRRNEFFEESVDLLIP